MTKKLKQTTVTSRRPEKIHPTELAGRWPLGELPLVMFGINGHRTVLATALRPVRFATWSEQTWRNLAQGRTGLPRFIGVIPYDEYCPDAHRKTTPLLFEIHECLIWQGAQTEPTLVRTGNPESCPLRLSEASLKELWQDVCASEPADAESIALTPAMSEDHYLSQAEEVLQHIRAGTFYQLNLLRWFRTTNTPTWQSMCRRLAVHGGPCSMLIRHGHTAIASLSPERFIQIKLVDGQPIILTSPIKGTAERDLSDPKKDEFIKEQLIYSAKDLAELSMIVDLMRNDLTRVCLPQTVRVTVPNTVATFQHVHHLVAELEGHLNGDLTMKTIFGHLCPGGSITGAPKIEVMKHIRRLEGRDRGFAMGNAFVMDADGFFDSNILIRTATSLDDLRSWDYAAGSGIVIKSSPRDELMEIAAKCRPLTHEEKLHHVFSR